MLHFTSREGEWLSCLWWQVCPTRVIAWCVRFISSRFFYGTNGIIIEALVHLLCLFIFPFFISLSLLSLFKNYNEERREKKKRPWTHIETPTTILSVSLKRSLQNESNDINKVHQRWTSELYLSSKINESLAVFEWQVWYTRVTICDFSWFYWIRLVEIFLIVTIIS